MSKVMIISSDCHAGALPGTYEEYMPSRYHAAARAWWLKFMREMMARAGTFFDQEAVDDYTENAGDGGGRINVMANLPTQIEDDALWAMLTDEASAFAPRRGEFDAEVRLAELEADGIVESVRTWLAMGWRSH